MSMTTSYPLFSEMGVQSVPGSNDCVRPHRIRFQLQPRGRDTQHRLLGDILDQMGISSPSTERAADDVRQLDKARVIHGPIRTRPNSTYTSQLLKEDRLRPPLFWFERSRTIGEALRVATRMVPDELTGIVERWCI